jgi:hypothetical protein
MLGKKFLHTIWAGRRGRASGHLWDTCMCVYEGASSAPRACGTLTAIISVLYGFRLLFQSPGNKRHGWRLLDNIEKISHSQNNCRTLLGQEGSKYLYFVISSSKLEGLMCIYRNQLWEMPQSNCREGDNNQFPASSAICQKKQIKNYDLTFASLVFYRVSLTG